MIAMPKEKTFAASLGVKAITAHELGFELSGKSDAIEDEGMDTYLAIQENIKNAAASRIAANVQRAMAQGPALEEGTQISGYEYVDIMCVSPRKPFIAPPWINLPHKLVAGGELIVHRAMLMVNPLPGPGGTPSGTQVLGSRDCRVTFNLLNVTTTAFWVGSFPGLAPVLTLFDWTIFHPDPGPNPQIYELNVTFDCLDPEQPYAAFATQWWDIDSDPGWPWYLPGPTVPTVSGGRRVQAPLRYLVFTE